MMTLLEKAKAALAWAQNNMGLLVWAKDKLRTSEFGLIALAGAAFIYEIAPSQIEVVVYKLALITGFAYLGYWIDRRAFPYARPHIADDIDDFNARQIRRAIIIGATTLAGALAL